MIRKIESSKMGASDLGWLHSKFHFSFAEYYNPKNTNFGVLRVINDDLVDAQKGFDMHPHKDMEIISYVVHGEMTHGDSMGNKKTITRGQVQYMSAGTGVYHSEFNWGKETLRLLQIWIFPEQNHLKPNYGDFRFDWQDRQNKWLHMVSGQNGEAPIKIHQDANLYAIELEAGKEINFPVHPDRQAYLVQIEGSSHMNDISLDERDGSEIVGENITIKARTTSHILIIEMKKEA